MKLRDSISSVKSFFFEALRGVLVRVAEPGGNDVQDNTCRYATPPAPRPGVCARRARRARDLTPEYGE